MVELPRLRLAEWLMVALVVGIAAGVRLGYVAACADQGAQPGPFAVQERNVQRAADSEDQRGGPADYASLVHHLQEDRWFAAKAPLADQDESTSQVAPSYYWLAYWLGKFDPAPEAALRWLQAALGTLTVLCYVFFVRRAFQSMLAATLTGLLLALHPFWIINTAELADGVLASFLLAAALALGTRASQVGDAFTSLLFGLSLAALAMTRAALLPFALVALIWFLFRCRSIKLGWFCGLLAFLGFANGLAPWTVRNFQAFGEPVPIVTTTYLHLYMGNNPKATGGPLSEDTLRASLPAERLTKLLAEPNQAKRYTHLGRDVVENVTADPSGTLARRLDAVVYFFFGESWFTQKALAVQETTKAEPPAWVSEKGEMMVRAALLVMLVLGLLGWRMSHGWRHYSRLAAVALVWTPLPYILGHAESLSGPRLPLDGVLMCFAGFALACLWPGTARRPERRKVA